MKLIDDVKDTLARWAWTVAGRKAVNIAIGYGVSKLLTAAIVAKLQTYGITVEPTQLTAGLIAGYAVLGDYIMLHWHTAKENTADANISAH